MITSRRNPMIQRMRAVAAGAKSAPEGLCFVEGVRLAGEWLRSGLEADTVLVAESFGRFGREAELLERISETGCEPVVVSDGVFASVSNVKAPQGIAVALCKPVWSAQDMLKSPAPLLVVAEGVQDPGNVGTIIRTAHAAGANGAIVTAGSANPFGAKAIRASAGSALHLPVIESVPFAESAELLRAAGLKLPGCSAGGRLLHTEADLTGPVALVLGREGSGLSAQAQAACDELIRIPMAGGVESLNVAATAAIVLFEAVRQRANAMRHGG